MTMFAGLGLVAFVFSILLGIICPIIFTTSSRFGYRPYDPTQALPIWATPPRANSTNYPNSGSQSIGLGGVLGLEPAQP